MSRTSDHNSIAQVMAEPSRRMLLEHLRLRPMSVGELVQATGFKQPNVSNHLAKMRDMGIVRAERIGRQVYYSLSTPLAEIVVRTHLLADNPHLLAPDCHSQTAEEIARQEITPEQLTEWRQNYARMAVAGREEQALAVVNAMLAAGVRLETLYLEVFQKAMYAVGDWYAGRAITEAQEHLASAITERMMAKVTQFYDTVLRSGHRAVLGCVAGNWHAIGVRMLADGLKERGWETLYLGANVPTPSFLSIVETSQPDLVVIGCGMEMQYPETQMLVSLLQNLRTQNSIRPFLITAGGRYLHEHPDRARALNLDFTGADLGDFLHSVEEHFPMRLQSASPLPQETETSTNNLPASKNT